MKLGLTLRPTVNVGLVLSDNINQIVFDVADPIIAAMAPFFQGPQGIPGSASAAYSHNQVTPSDTWLLNHNLGFYPNVEVRSVGGKEMIGEIIHTSINQVIVYFDSAFAGTATCS
jgi:hypothetical protein